MYQQLKLKEMVTMERERCVKKIKQMEGEMRWLPEGHLSSKNNNYYQVIYDKGMRSQQIISKKNTDHDQLVSDLKRKRHIVKALPILKANLKSYDKFLEKILTYDMCEISAGMAEIYRDFDFSQLLLEGDVYERGWSDIDYVRNLSYPENLRHRSENGVATRSKSEAMIATKLEQADLKFRYDSVEKFGMFTYSPDFKILHTKQRRFIYWEHFGMMDDDEYACKAMKKIQDYGKCGLHVGDNLIITWETKATPLTYEVITDQIESAFY